jgi:hypothetical protein
MIHESLRRSLLGGKANSRRDLGHRRRPYRSFANAPLADQNRLSLKGSKASRLEIEMHDEMVLTVRSKTRDLKLETPVSFPVLPDQQLVQGVAESSQGRLLFETSAQGRWSSPGIAQPRSGIGHQKWLWE